MSKSAYHLKKNVQRPFYVDHFAPFVRPKCCKIWMWPIYIVEGECLKQGVIYQAEVSRDDGIVDTYIGLAATSFKARWSNHCSSFRTRNPKNSTTLSKYIWGLEDKNIGYQVKWKIMGSAPPYNHVTDKCHLCVREKYFIIFQPEKATINSRNEIAGHCPHKEGQLLKKS